MVLDQPETIMGFDSASPVGSGGKKPGLQHWEGASTCSCAPLSNTDQLSLPPCAAGDFLPILKLICSVFCRQREIHPSKPGSARHGVPHAGQRGILTFLGQMGLGTSPGRAQYSKICSRGVFVKRWALPEVFLSNAGSWESQL